MTAPWAIGQNTQLMRPLSLKCPRTEFHQTWVWR